jgi:hypothetical protein
MPDPQVLEVDFEPAPDVTRPVVAAQMHPLAAGISSMPLKAMASAISSRTASPLALRSLRTTRGKRLWSSTTMPQQLDA